MKFDIVGVLQATSFPALTGAITTSAGALATTLAASAVANSNLANMAANTVKGNNTGSSAAPTDLTGAQAQLIIGGCLQCVTAKTSALVSMTTLMAYSDNIPQITEGTEVLAVTITPKSASSTLVIRFSTFGTCDTANQALTTALFQDSTADALAANGVNITSNSADKALIYTLQHFMTSGTTSATTFRIRMGSEASGTFVVNGKTFGGVARRFGGVASTTLTVEEFL